MHSNAINQDINGILIVDKPQDMTSHDVVDFVRRKFKIKKVGHAGTLDPMATGVLVLLLGSYTKKSGTLSGDDKEYEGMLVLGAKTDTGDKYGKFIEGESHVSPVEKERLLLVFKEFTGPISQTPPAFSALKHKGTPLYKFARKGIMIKKKPRDNFISKLEMLRYEYPDVAFRVSCSKGTYVRSLCQDIGERLGCGGYLSQLRRTKSGNFYLTDALAFEALRSMTRDEVRKHLCPVQ